LGELNADAQVMYAFFLIKHPVVHYSITNRYEVDMNMGRNMSPLHL